MKLNYTLLLIAFSIVFTVSFKKETLAPFSPKNYLSKFQTEKPQFFDLDTLEYKNIIGKHGTKINFNRESFEVNEGEKVQLELVELYDFKEVLYRNIQTLTTDNKLLESSGVLKVVFTSNGKELKLREGEILKVYPPKGKLKDNDIFLSQTDSLGNVTWNITNQDYCDFAFYIGGGISMLKTVSCDSVSVYRERQVSYMKELKEKYDERSKISNKKKSLDFFILKENTSKWINIDRFINAENKITFDLEDENEEFSGFNVYVNYERINSFIYETRLMDELRFSNIPLSGKTFIRVIGENKNGLFYDEIELKETMHNSKIQLNMKKTTSEDLKKIFE